MKLSCSHKVSKERTSLVIGLPMTAADDSDSPFAVAVGAAGRRVQGRMGESV